MEYIIENNKLEIKCSYDVVVCGGGVAGISAALAAARAGSRVCLIEKQYILGGLATSGIVTIYLPLCDGLGNQVSFGICEELFHLSIKHGWEDKYPKWWLKGGTHEQKKIKRFEVRFNPQLFALETVKLLVNEGVDILYGTSVCGMHKDRDRLSALIVENKSGRYAISASSFVDATGDADLCHFADAPCREYEKKNSLAAWYYYANKDKVDLKMLGFSDVPNEDDKDAEEQDKVLINERFSGLDAVQNSRMTILSQETILNNFQKSHNEDNSLYPVTIPTIPQLRMTRCLKGDYILRETDVHKSFADSVGMICDWRKRGPIFEIPFSSLYSKSVKNLITAGRCISVDDDMWDVSRVIPACAVTGEAAGTAAAMTDDFSSLDIAKLQQVLRKNSVRLTESELQLHI